MTTNITRAAEIIAPWIVQEWGLPDDKAASAAEALAAEGLLASGTIEYRVEHKHIDGGFWHPVTRWSPEWPLHEGRTVAPDERIVCRRVSAVWEVTADNRDER